MKSLKIKINHFLILAIILRKLIFKEIINFFFQKSFNFLRIFIYFNICNCKVLLKTIKNILFHPSCANLWRFTRINCITNLKTIWNVDHWCMHNLNFCIVFFLILKWNNEIEIYFIEYYILFKILARNST